MGDRKIYLLLTDTGTLFTRIIKTYTKKPYNHASIAFDEELTEVYSFGRKQIHNPFNAGLVREDTRAGLFQHADCAIYSLTVTTEQYYKMKQYIQVMYKQKEKYHYNLIGLLGVMFNKPIKIENAFFCSQFVASVLQECHIINFKKDLSLIEPHEIPNRAVFHLVYEGKLMNYHNILQGERIAYPFLFSSVKA